MSYVIGIDGGGTKSRLLLTDLSGRTILEKLGGPTNLYALGPEATVRELHGLIDAAVKEAGLAIEDCSAVCLGNAGVDRPEERLHFERMLASCGIQGKITVTNDAETVLVAGSGRREGIVIISGTGSLAYGIDDQGIRTRAGGWGHLAGDEGSGFDIGIRAVRSALCSYDGREPETLLLPYLLEVLKLEEAEQLKVFVYTHQGKQHIAALAKVVYDAYLNGDAKAENILTTAVEGLYELADTVIRRMEYGQREFHLVCGGSIFKYNHYVFAEFSRRIRGTYPGIRIVIPDRDAAYGAAKIALLSL
ncbi:BadF/BadG/BcrA/BcrD ATPase family protein [Paenibacillus sp. NPDC058071]|uniref:BadF/BadG/BcrA/BcrD ATPase family protein n=1 Tax=Paenibacillus sp. NPDC058071 TaxID=3346326 RepID=UPI0036DAA493